MVCNELAVVIVDSDVNLVQDWDVKLCAAMREMPVNSIVSAFEPLCFPVFALRQLSSQQQGLCIETRRFAMQAYSSTSAIVQSLASSERLAACYGSCFKALPAVDPRVYATSRSSLAFQFSSYIFKAGCHQFAFLHQLFAASHSSKRYAELCNTQDIPTMSARYLDVAGVIVSLGDVDKEFGAEHDDHDDHDDSSNNTKRLASFVLKPQAMLGVTSAAMEYIYHQEVFNFDQRGTKHNGHSECVDKYATRQEAERQLRLSIWNQAL